MEGEAAPGKALGGTRPSMSVGEVLEERRRRANKAAGHAGAAARRVGTRLRVRVPGMVRRPENAAVDGVRAGDPDGVHHLLHSEAAAEAGSSAAHVALVRRCQLAAARRAQNVPHVALNIMRSQTKKNSELLTCVIKQKKRVLEGAL